MSLFKKIHTLATTTALSLLVLTIQAAKEKDIDIVKLNIDKKTAHRICDKNGKPIMDIQFTNWGTYLEEEKKDGNSTFKTTLRITNKSGKEINSVQKVPIYLKTKGYLDFNTKVLLSFNDPDESIMPNNSDEFDLSGPMLYEADNKAVAYVTAKKYLKGQSVDVRSQPFGQQSAVQKEKGQVMGELSQDMIGVEEKQQEQGSMLNPLNWFRSKQPQKKQVEKVQPIQKKSAIAHQGRAQAAVPQQKPAKNVHHKQANIYQEKSEIAHQEQAQPAVLEKADSELLPISSSDEEEPEQEQEEESEDDEDDSDSLTSIILKTKPIVKAVEKNQEIIEIKVPRIEVLPAYRVEDNNNQGFGQEIEEQKEIIIDNNNNNNQNTETAEQKQARLAADKRQKEAEQLEAAKKKKDAEQARLKAKAERLEAKEKQLEKELQEANKKLEEANKKLKEEEKKQNPKAIAAARKKRSKLHEELLKKIDKKEKTHKKLEKVEEARLAAEAEAAQLKKELDKRNQTLNNGTKAWYQKTSNQIIGGSTLLIVGFLSVYGLGKFMKLTPTKAIGDSAQEEDDDSDDDEDDEEEDEDDWDN